MMAVADTTLNGSIWPIYVSVKSIGCKIGTEVEPYS